MQITSLTGFPFKRASVHGIKVPFLLEIGTGVGSAGGEGLMGGEGQVSLYGHRSVGPGARGAAAISIGFVCLERG